MSASMGRGFRASTAGRRGVGLWADEGTTVGEFWPVTDVLAHLAGRWRVDRTVRDLASGAEGHFEGATVFRPLDGGGLLHEESGTFTWQGVARPAERTLRFLPGPRPGTADVRFADDRPFHDLDLASGRYVADHPCSADLYRGEFTVQDTDHWRTVWRVGGPAKDLVLTTDYVREERPKGALGRIERAATAAWARPATTAPHPTDAPSRPSQRSAYARDV